MTLIQPIVDALGIIATAGTVIIGITVLAIYIARIIVRVLE